MYEQKNPLINNTNLSVSSLNISSITSTVSPDPALVYDIIYLEFSIENTLDSDITNLYITTATLSGLSFQSSNYTIIQNSNVPIGSGFITPSNDIYSLPPLPSNTLLNFAIAYRINLIPTSLTFSASSTLNYTYNNASYVEYITSNSISINALIKITTINGSSITSTLPIVNSTNSNLVYSLFANGSFGIATISQEGIVTYTPNNSEPASDTFIISVFNSQSSLSSSITYNVTLTTTETNNESINLLLSSVALEEISLSHIINAEGEKLQYILGTLSDSLGNPIVPPANVTISDLLSINSSVSNTLQDVAKNQLLLTYKLKEINNLLENQ